MQTHRLLLPILCFLFPFQAANAQWALRTDPFNLMFLNYNLGIERHKNAGIAGFDFSYLQKGWVWQNEFPGHAPAEGFRLNLDYKRTFRKAPKAYAGIMVRLEKLHFEELSHWRAFYTYSRDDRRFTMAGKLGLRIGNGWFKTDFGIGPAVRFLKREQILISTDPPYGEITQEELTSEAVSELNRQSHGFRARIVPMLHLQTVITPWQKGTGRRTAAGY